MASEEIAQLAYITFKMISVSAKLHRINSIQLSAMHHLDHITLFQWREVKFSATLRLGTSDSGNKTKSIYTGNYNLSTYGSLAARGTSQADVAVTFAKKNLDRRLQDAKHTCSNGLAG